MSVPDCLDSQLSLPLIAAPMFLASGPDLVIACCKSGIVGTFPAKNQRTLEGLESWLQEITSALQTLHAETGKNRHPLALILSCIELIISCKKSWNYVAAMRCR